MINTVPFLMLEQPYEQALMRVAGQLGSLGMRVMVTFDLQHARGAHSSWICPRHGTQACDCRLNVLLVYEKESGPVSLLAHGYDGKTWFSLIDTPQQPVDPHLGAAIREILTPRGLI